MSKERKVTIKVMEKSENTIHLENDFLQVLTKILLDISSENEK